MDDPTGHTYEDAEGRTLRVDGYRPQDHLGRAIRGVIFPPGGAEGRPYVTDVATFHSIWIEQRPRWISKEEAA